MPQTCTVCGHPDRATIDQDLRSGTALRDIAGRYALSKSALARHKQEHVLAIEPHDGDRLTAQIEAWQRQREQAYAQLRHDARAAFRAMEGWAVVKDEAEWRQICADAHRDYKSGHFLIERLGAARFLDPALMATLWQLRQGLLAEGGGTPSPTETMVVDMTVLSYANLLRVQGWLGNLALLIESEFFGQESLRATFRREYGYQVDGLKVEDQLGEFADELLPLLDRLNRLVLRNLKALQELRRGSTPSVAIGHAGQVNVAEKQITVMQERGNTFDG